MKIKSLYLAGAMAAVIMTTSCSSKKQITYFQDLKPGQESVIANLSPIKLQPNDKVSIVVSTGDSRLNSLFNLPVARTNISQENTNGKVSSGGSESTSPYTLDSQGDINFPVLGKLHVAGMTREELAEYIRRELISRDLAKNPIVTVEYLNLSVTVLGEVGHPGRFAIDREDYTILDALSAAGDLTIFGQRDNIRVLREENGVQRVYDVNLNSGLNLTQSPVYYLQQNDVIYVEPNGTKARQSTPNGNSALTPSFWISIASFAASITTVIISVTK
ncbi:MAG: polysaccharide biosynthesis/export family protein [Muribaculaceae bacterium]|nr:polysaccharide biosynthesis/export family protein [Muribaculaceae bacterium]